VEFGPNHGPYHVGWVTPALHYSLGGVSIDAKGRVKRNKDGGDAIQGLFAAGEITGGVHGVNRLGGNALTECVVFGQLVGETISLTTADDESHDTVGVVVDTSETPAAPKEKREITAAEIATHNASGDCWIAVYGDVYVCPDGVAVESCWPLVSAVCGVPESLEKRTKMG
jgi:succinate dehydrogenase/fumarate reductase flavoprotein subunit